MTWGVLKMRLFNFVKSLFKKKVSRPINVPVKSVKKHLKGMSKNQLIKFIIDQQMEIEILKKGIKKIK